MKKIMCQKQVRGFTLIELLIVIAILSIIATVVLLVINPAQMIKQTRDSNRIAELNQINKALLIFQSFGGTGMGTVTKVYVSIPSAQADCSDLGLPALGGGYTYVCSNSTNYRKLDGTGWIPINLASVQSSAGSLFASLPIDPINTVADGYYYTYIPGSWALSATMESEKFIASNAANDGGQSTTRFEMGNSLVLNSNLGTDIIGCGNNIKQTGEVCDGTDLNSQTCATQLGAGYTGTLSCNAGCSAFVTTSCVAPWACGDTLTDSRDSKTYATVLIGSQCWMAQHINYGTMIAGAGNQTDNATIEKYCYDDTESNCTSDGGLYQWDEAMQYAASCNGTGVPPDDACATPVQGICPAGWHIPSHYEYTTLEKNVGSNPDAFPYDIVTTDWLGTDEGTNLKVGGSSGFEGLLAGDRETDGSFFDRGSLAYVWSSLESGSSAWSRRLYSGYATVYRFAYSKLYGFSVRCLKD